MEHLAPLTRLASILPTWSVRSHESKQSEWLNPGGGDGGSIGAYLPSAMTTQSWRGWERGIGLGAGAASGSGYGLQGQGQGQDLG